MRPMTRAQSLLSGSGCLSSPRGTPTRPCTHSSSVETSRDRPGGIGGGARSSARRAARRCRRRRLALSGLGRGSLAISGAAGAARGDAAAPLPRWGTSLSSNPDSPPRTDSLAGTGPASTREGGVPGSSMDTWPSSRREGDSQEKPSPGGGVGPGPQMEGGDVGEGSVWNDQGQAPGVSVPARGKAAAWPGQGQTQQDPPSPTRGSPAGGGQPALPQTVHPSICGRGAPTGTIITRIDGNGFVSEAGRA